MQERNNREEEEIRSETIPPTVTEREIREREVREEEPMEWQPPLKPARPASRVAFNGGGIGKTAVVSLVVAILVVILLGMMGGGMFVTKKDFETNMANLAVSVNEASASVNAAVQSLPNTVTTTVNKAISQQTDSLNDSINKVNGTVANLQGSVSTLSNDVAALSTKLDEEATARKKRDDEIVAVLTEHGTQIKALQEAKEEEEDTTSVDGDLVFEVKDYSEDVYIDLPEGTEEAPGSYYFLGEIGKLSISNQSNKAIEDVRLTVEVSFSRALPDREYTVFMSGGTSWSVVSQSTSRVRFRSSRFNLSVGQTKKMYLEFEISGEGVVGSSKKVYFNEIEAEVDDYDIVK